MAKVERAIGEHRPTRRCWEYLFDAIQYLDTFSELDELLTMTQGMAMQSRALFLKRPQMFLSHIARDFNQSPHTTEKMEMPEAPLSHVTMRSVGSDGKVYYLRFSENEAIFTGAAEKKVSLPSVGNAQFDVEAKKLLTEYLSLYRSRKTVRHDFHNLLMRMGEMKPENAFVLELEILKRFVRTLAFFTNLAAAKNGHDRVMRQDMKEAILMSDHYMFSAVDLFGPTERKI